MRTLCRGEAATPSLFPDATPARFGAPGAQASTSRQTPLSYSKTSPEAGGYSALPAGCASRAMRAPSGAVITSTGFAAIGSNSPVPAGRELIPRLECRRNLRPDSSPFGAGFSSCAPRRRQCGGNRHRHACSFHASALHPVVCGLAACASRHRSCTGRAALCGGCAFRHGRTDSSHAAPDRIPVQTAGKIRRK